MKRAEKKQHLVDVAIKLFNQYGYQASGVDRIIEASGIAKTTLYRHFPSKDDLIVAALQKLSADFRKDFYAAVEKSSSHPKKRLLATFDYIQLWFDDEAFYGCPFIGAASEFCERDTPIFAQVRDHKNAIKSYFIKLAEEAGYAQPQLLGEQLNLLHEGAIAVAHVQGSNTAAEQAKRLAEQLLLQTARV